jgi:glycosyl transferase, family 25
VSQFATYLINLDRAPARLDVMDRQLSALGIAYERVSAIDGKTLTLPIAEFDLPSYRRRHGRNFHPGEVGCYLSHVGALRRFLATDQKYALILEDDCRIASDIIEIIHAAIAQSSTWDLLRLSTVSTDRTIRYSSLSAQRNLAIALLRMKGSGAYLVNRHCATIFVDRLLPMSLAWDIAFDTEFMLNLKAAFVSPVPVDQNIGFESAIQSDTQKLKRPIWRYLTVFPWRAWIESNRFVRRGARVLAIRLSGARQPRKTAHISS